MTEFEAYDSKLAQRVQSLSSNIETLNLRLANLRRTAPATAAESFRTSFAKQTEAFDAQARREEEAKLAAARAEKMDVGDFERWDDMLQTWRVGTEEMVKVGSGVEETARKVERAKRAVLYIERQ